MGDQEHRVERQQRRHQLGVRIGRDRLATDRGHSTQQARRHRQSARERQQSGGVRVSGRRVRHLLHGRGGAQVQVLVFRA
jgi:hypothetical protein